MFQKALEQVDESQEEGQVVSAQRTIVQRQVHMSQEDRRDGTSGVE